MLTHDTGSFPSALTEERALDRRRFLCAAGAAALVVVAGEALARLARRRQAAPPSIDPEALAGLAPGEARALAAGDREALAVRLADGTLVAFDRRCPHLGCPVVWAADRNRFECPCHRAAFAARSGALLFGPPRAGLTPITVTKG